MAGNIVYTEAKRMLLAGELDFDLPNDIRVILVMAATTCDTEEDVATMGAFGTLDEFDGSGYTPTGTGFALTGEGVTKVDGSDLAYFDATNYTWSALGNGTTQITGVVVFKWDTNFSSSKPLCYLDQGGFPFDPNGGDVTIQWNAVGILQAT